MNLKAKYKAFYMFVLLYKDIKNVYQDKRNLPIF